jgi:hypothetical protein
MQLQLYGNKIFLFRKPIDFRKSIDRLSVDIQGKAFSSEERNISAVTA